MTSSVKVNGIWTSIKAPYAKISGVWKPVKSAYTKVGGTWKNWFLQGGVNDALFDQIIGSGTNNAVNSVAVQADGKILLGVGRYATTWNGQWQQFTRLMRLFPDGTVDSAFSTGVGTAANFNVTVLKIQLDEKIIAGGDFTSWNGVSAKYLVRLNSDGTRDTSFSTNLGVGANDRVRAIALQTDGKILVGGDFSSWNGTAVGHLVRLNSDGTIDSSFNTSLGTGGNSGVLSIQVQQDGKIVVAGTFTQWAGSTAGRVARLNSNGTKDAAFITNIDVGATGSNPAAHAAVVLPDSKILISGAFALWRGTTVNGLVKLNSDGTRDTSFTNNTGTGVGPAVGGFDPLCGVVCAQKDGKLVLGGTFTSWNGVSAKYLVRLNSDGTRDTSFSTNGGVGLNTSGYVYGIVAQSDEKLVVVGNFTSYSGLSKGFVMRIGGSEAFV